MPAAVKNKYTQEQPPSPQAIDYPARLNVYLERQFRLLANQGIELTFSDVKDNVRYAHLFATGGDGTENNPWTHNISNPVQAALEDLPETGGIVFAIDGFFDLGTFNGAVSIPKTSAVTDPRCYSIIGAGQSHTFFNYSGLGEAISMVQVNNGSFQRSVQGNKLLLKGFSLRQLGTPYTGIGIRLNYVSYSIIEDVCVGTVRFDRFTGGSPTGFEYGIFVGNPDNIPDDYSDFNHFRDSRLCGNKFAMRTTNGTDATILSNLWVEPDQMSSTVQTGISLTNCNGVQIQGCHFNFFRQDSTVYGLRFNSYTQGVVVSGNYFEGNTVGIDCFNIQDQFGINIIGNYFAVNPVGTVTSFGIRAGLGSILFRVRGLNIMGNTFHSLNAPGGFGIKLDSDVEDYRLIGNNYAVGGTPKILIAGSKGFEWEPTNGSNDFPHLHLRSYGASTGYIVLENTNTGVSGNSPGFIFRPGGTAKPQFRLEGTSGGALVMIDDTGLLVPFTWAQDGTQTMLKDLKLGGFAEYTEIAAPSTPAANKLRLYAKDNGSGVSNLYFLDDAGVEHDLGAGGGGGGSVTGIGTDEAIVKWTNGAGGVIGDSATFADYFDGTWHYSKFLGERSGFNIVLSLDEITADATFKASDVGASGGYIVTSTVASGEGIPVYDLSGGLANIRYEANLNWDSTNRQIQIGDGTSGGAPGIWIFGASSTHGQIYLSSGPLLNYDTPTGRHVFKQDIDLTGVNIRTDTSTGTKIGLGTGQKLGFWNTAPVIQPTIAGTAAATLVAVGGANIQANDTFDGYTLQKVVRALRVMGLLT
jgi:hypothetical protein